ncbi:3-mercaptopyruvate sulfurtransferase [Asticcacaulis sp.]|uniref:3-mercaptopyruvate sulfurtransferase n=1 Tax=Asticcacaulis sp. TaxID=1872648 RepID=UPI003F7BF967
MTTQIEPRDLAKLMEDGAVKILDGSWALDGTDMRALYKADHIPGAQFFDLEAISDHSTLLPHMAPSPDQFSAAIGNMGISETDHVVIYDRLGLFSAARVWWTFRLMGHEKVQVLRGGLPAWKAAGFPVTDQTSIPDPITYAASHTPENIININDLQNILKAEDSLILDARPKARFEGTAPEPRAGLRSGHMPGSRSLPFGELVRNGALKPKEELHAIFQFCGVGDTGPIVTTCGSGVTAAIISMALFETGHTSARLYDGSWAEWGQESLDNPVVTGA